LTLFPNLRYIAIVELVFSLFLLRIFAVHYVYRTPRETSLLLMGLFLFQIKINQSIKLNSIRGVLEGII